jgi:hypothetical protein
MMIGTKNYVIKKYQKGMEADQVRIGQEVAREWIWPYAYDLDDLLAIHARPDFDPDTRHYCFLGEEMVGYMFSTITSTGEGEERTATLDFPRMLAGHEDAAEMLMEKAFEILIQKSVSRVTGWVTSMCPGNIELAEKMGFSIHDWGSKVYYSYEMDWGKLDVPSHSVEEVNPDKDLPEYAQVAAKWYKQPREWCRAYLAEWHAEVDIIAHLGVREEGALVAACMTAPNLVRPSTAANYYIYVLDQSYLQPLLAKAVNKCVDFGVINLIADLINEHRPYEHVYQELGFKKVAEWAQCQKVI